MNKLNVIFFYFFYLLCGEILAQTNFLPGYYITESRDTVRGYIDYRSERKNNSVCFFKKSEESEIVRLLPSQIAGFVVSDTDFYETHVHKTRKGAELFGFFRVMVRGSVSLFRFESDYYAMDSSGQIFDLSDKPVDAGSVRRKDYYRIGILKVLLKDCEALSNNLEKKYKSNDDLEKILREYHECLGKSYFQTKALQIAPAVKIGVSASLVYSGLSFKGDGFHTEFNTKFVPEVGPYFYFFIPRIGDQLRLLSEVLYGQNDTYSFYGTDYVNNDFYAKYSYLRIPTYLRYARSMLFFEGGLSTQIIIDQELRWRREVFSSGSVDTEDQPTGKLPILNPGFVAGVGIRIHAGNVQVQPAIRLSQTFGLHDAYGYGAKFQTLEVNLKLNFD